MGIPYLESTFSFNFLKESTEILDIFFSVMGAAGSGVTSLQAQQEASGNIFLNLWPALTTSRA